MRPHQRNVSQLSLVLFVQGLPLLFPHIPALVYAALIVNAILSLVFIIQSPTCFSWIAMLKQHLNAKSISWGLMLGVALGFAANWFFLPLFSQWFHEPLALDAPSKLSGNFKFIFLLFLGIALTSGVCYEMVWRGFLYERTKQVAHSEIVAVILTALASGVFTLHLGYAQSITAVLVSLVLALVYKQTRYNIVLAIVAHTFTDSLFFIAVYLNLPTSI